MNSMWLNVGSVVLGLCAWGLPFVAMTRFRMNKVLQGMYSIYASLLCAIGALLGVVLYRNDLIRIEDWSALLDTAGGFYFASVILVVITVCLNSIALAFKTKIHK